MEIHGQAIVPFGKLELKLSSLYILMINGVIDRLRVSENATISYTGSFTSSYKVRHLIKQYLQLVLVRN